MRRTRWINPSLACALALGLLLPACSDGNERTEIVVMAASSLTDAFSAIETNFEAAHPDIDLVMVFGASSTLATQIVDGAPADVFASADAKQFDVIAADVDIDEPIVFATNSLVIMVGAGNPKSIDGLVDLGRDDVLVATANDGVPIRKYTDQLMVAAEVTPHYVTFEANVAGIVTKITTGSADAGVVYTSDLVGAGSSVQSVAIPDDLNITARYPIATISSSDHVQAARQLVEFVTSANGREILTKFGFGAP